MTALAEVRSIWNEAMNKFYEAFDAAHDALLDKGYETEIEREELKAIEDMCFRLRDIIECE